MKVLLPLLIFVMAPVYAQSQIGLDEFKRIVQENAGTFFSYEPGQTITRKTVIKSSLETNNQKINCEVESTSSETVLKLKSSLFYSYETPTFQRSLSQDEKCKQLFPEATQAPARLLERVKAGLADIKVPEGVNDFVITHLVALQFRLSMSHRVVLENGTSLIMPFFMTVDLSLPQLANPVETRIGELSTTTLKLATPKDPRTFDVSHISLCKEDGDDKKCEEPKDHTVLIFQE